MKDNLEDHLGGDDFSSEVPLAEAVKKLADRVVDLMIENNREEDRNGNTGKLRFFLGAKIRVDIMIDRKDRPFLLEVETIQATCDATKKKKFFEDCMRRFCECVGDNSFSKKKHVQSVRRKTRSAGRSTFETLKYNNHEMNRKKARNV